MKRKSTFFLMAVTLGCLAASQRGEVLAEERVSTVRPMKGHSWHAKNFADMLREMAEQVKKNMPSGDNRAWQSADQRIFHFPFDICHYLSFVIGRRKQGKCDPMKKKWEMENDK
jgi:hypothetical protein